MQVKKLKVFVGYDSRYPESYGVTVASIRKHSPHTVITPIVLAHLRGEGHYTRPTSGTKEKLFDDISEAPMATQFAISRFLVPYLSGFKGLSVFCDGDFMFRDDVQKLVEFMNDDTAISVVQHQYVDSKKTKMNGQAQLAYDRKNWSSLMAFNNSHPDLQYLQRKAVNSATGRHLHSLTWLPKESIGALPESWNWLDGHSKSANPSAVHFTRGTPEMGIEPTAYGDEWNEYREAVKCAL